MRWLSLLSASDGGWWTRALDARKRPLCHRRQQAFSLTVAGQRQSAKDVGHAEGVPVHGTKSRAKIVIGPVAMAADTAGPFQRRGSALRPRTDIPDLASLGVLGTDKHFAPRRVRRTEGAPEPSWIERSTQG